ncbi:MAG: hypothetical protein ABJB01_04550 [Rudaea sp.]
MSNSTAIFSATSKTMCQASFVPGRRVEVLESALPRIVTTRCCKTTYILLTVNAAQLIYRNIVLV